MDGMFIGGTPPPANRRADRVDLRRMQNPDQQFTMVLRQGEGPCMPAINWRCSKNDALSAVAKADKP